MFEEAPVFGGEHRLDDDLGELVEGQGIVVADAAMPHGLAVAVEEADGEILLLQPVVGGLLHGERRQREHQHGACRAHGQALAGALHEQAPPAPDAEAIHEAAERIPTVAGPLAALVHRVVDPGIEREHGALQPPLPTRAMQIVEHV